MKRLFTILSLTLVVFASCDVDKYYGSDDDPRAAGATLNTWEMLNENAEIFSKFIQLCEMTGMDSELNKNRMLTVWAPSDQYITEEIFALDEARMKRFVMNHISSLPVYYAKLVTKYDVLTLASKVLRVSRMGGKYTIDDVQIGKYDMACKNGVVHEMRGIMIPRLSLYEYLEELDDSYSTFVDSLFSYNEIIFLPEESFPIGVDSVGRTIYDSVFKIENSFLGFNVDLLSEEDSYTLLLPNNDAITRMYETAVNYFNGINREFTGKDSVTAFKWLLRSSIFDSELTHFGDYAQRTSALGEVLRTDKQLISTDYERCSNGIVYSFERVYVPKQPYIQGFTTWICDYFITPEPLKSESFKSNVPFPNEYWVDLSAPTRYFLEWGNGFKGDYLEFMTLSKDRYGNITPALVMPGKYQLYGWIYGYIGCQTFLSVNGTPQMWKRNQGGYPLATPQYNFETNTNSYFEYGASRMLVDTLTVKDSWGYNQLNFRVEVASTANKAKWRSIELKPIICDENY